MRELATLFDPNSVLKAVSGLFFEYSFLFLFSFTARQRGLMPLSVNTLRSCEFKFAGEWVCQCGETGCELTGEPRRPLTMPTTPIQQVSSCSALIYATDANDSACVGNTELCMKRREHRS